MKKSVRHDFLRIVGFSEKVPSNPLCFDRFCRFAEIPEITHFAEKPLFLGVKTAKNPYPIPMARVILSKLSKALCLAHGFEPKNQ